MQYFNNFKYSIIREHEKLVKNFPDIEIKEEPVDVCPMPMYAVFVDNSELQSAVKIDPSILECQPEITEIEVAFKNENRDFLHPNLPFDSKFDYIPIEKRSRDNSTEYLSRRKSSQKKRKSGVRLFQCQYCSHQANHRGNLGRHIKAIHPEAEKEFLKIEPIPQKSGWLYKCDLCGYENDVRTNLLRHLRLKHPKRIKQECEKEKTGRNRFKCKDCDTSFYTQNRLIKHQNREHQDKNEIICVYCQSVFSTIELMREHCRHFHQKLGNSSRKKKKKEYILCPVCGNLVQKGLMKVHIAGVHNKEKKYLCTVNSIKSL